VQFTDFFTAARALRAISQAGLFPANCRILDTQEAFNTGAADGSVAILVLAFESGDHPIEPWMARALECCADHGGKAERADTADAHREGAAGAWRLSTAEAIEQGEWVSLGASRTCGWVAVAGLLIETQHRGLGAYRLALCNSGDTAGSRDRVVGYGAWMFGEAA